MFRKVKLHKLEVKELVTLIHNIIMGALVIERVLMKVIMKINKNEE